MRDGQNKTPRRTGAFPYEESEEVYEPFGLISA
jgi:hypothetical protein